MQTISTKGAPNRADTTGDPAPDLAGWMFEPDQVVCIELGVPRAHATRLAATPMSTPTGRLAPRPPGSYGPLNVGPAEGGQGVVPDARRQGGVKVKFNHSVPGQRLLGLES